MLLGSPEAIGHWPSRSAGVLDLDFSRRHAAARLAVGARSPAALGGEALVLVLPNPVSAYASGPRV